MRGSIESDVKRKTGIGLGEKKYVHFIKDVLTMWIGHDPFTLIKAQYQDTAAKEKPRHGSDTYV